MQPHFRQLLLCGAIALSLLPFTASATPVPFAELSLMVRARESESSISREVSQRQLAQKLSADQEATLRKQGASDMLISSLRNAAVAPQSAPVAAVAGRGRNAGALEDAATGDRGYNQPNVQIVDVEVGSPINLSAWGGVDREFVFSPRSITDLRRTYSFYEQRNFPFYRDPTFEPSSDELTMVEPAGTWTHTSTYLGLAGTQPYLNAYTSSTAHTLTRPLEVQRHAAVFIPGVPYTLYPVYAAGDVSLYYIGRISDNTVRVAVISHWR